VTVRIILPIAVDTAILVGSKGTLSVFITIIANIAIRAVRAIRAIRAVRVFGVMT
jgi:hypothetical protein